MSAVLSSSPPPSASQAEAVGAKVRHIDPPSGVQEALLSLSLNLSLRLSFKLLIRPPFPVGFQRAVMHALAVTMPPAIGVNVTRTHIATNWGRLPIERIRAKGGPGADGRARRAILFLHGGAFCVGSPRSHRSITTRLAKLTGAEVLAPHYRRTPEHAFPAQVDDCVSSYRQLLEDGYAPQNIAVIGDSAGGTLSLLTPMALQQLGLPLPGALVLMSPAVNLDAQGSSMVERAGRDPMLRPSWAEQARHWYAAPPEHPLADPLQQDFTRLPPTLVQVGSEEILFDHSMLFAQRASAGGAHVELEICDKRWHVFQIHAGLMPGSTQALERQAAFLARHWGA